MDKAKDYLVDLAIIAIFALMPGIRGYDNWTVLEFFVLVTMLVYILYLRHKKPAG